MSLLFFFGHTSITGVHIENVPIGTQATTQGMMPVAIGIQEHFYFLQSLGQYAQSILALVNRLETGDPFTGRSLLLNKLSEDVLGVHMLINSFSSYTTGVNALVNEIISDSLSRAYQLLNRIADVDYVQGQNLILGKIGDVTSVFSSTTYEIYLDNRRITNRVSQANIVCDESSVHNTIELFSMDKVLFNRSNPLNMQGESRIEVQVGSRVLYFLLERRFGDEMNFSLWGRSLSARDDSPYAESDEYSLTTPTAASDVAEGLLVYNSISWLCDDWVLPDTFSYSGPPLLGILQIANVIGAIVRSDDDGTIIVRNKFPVRPIDLDGTTADLNYDRDVLLQGLSYQEIPGEGYNTVEVFGKTSSEIYPSLQVEETSPLQAEVVHVRAYWDGTYPPTNLTTAITAPGTITQGVKTEKVVETVEFYNGVARSTYPVVTLQNTSWIGSSLGSLTVTKYGRNLVASGGVSNPTSGYGVAEVTYQTVYNRYTLSRHDISRLILILTYYTGNNIDILLKSMGSGDSEVYEAPTIADPLLTNESVAVLRGRNFIDASKYDMKIFNIRAPYDDDAIDGNIVFLTDGEIGCSGNFYIQSSHIIFRGPKVVNEMRVVQWQV